jgi:hypothetical protein
MYLRLILLKLFLNFYLLWVILFFQNYDPNFFAIFLLFTIFLNLHYIFHFFQRKIVKLKKIETKKICWSRGGGSIQLFKLKSHQLKLCFLLQKEHM